MPKSSAQRQSQVLFGRVFRLDLVVQDHQKGYNSSHYVYDMDRCDQKHVGQLYITGRPGKVIALGDHLRKAVELHNDKDNAQPQGHQEPVGRHLKLVLPDRSFRQNIGKTAYDNDGCAYKERGRQLQLTDPVLPGTTYDIGACPPSEAHDQAHDPEPKHHFLRPVVLLLKCTLC